MTASESFFKGLLRKWANWVIICNRQSPVFLRPPKNLKSTFPTCSVHSSDRYKNARRMEFALFVHQWFHKFLPWNFWAVYNLARWKIRPIQKVLDYCHIVWFVDIQPIQRFPDGAKKIIWNSLARNNVRIFWKFYIPIFSFELIFWCIQMVRSTHQRPMLEWLVLFVNFLLWYNGWYETWRWKRFASRPTHPQLK